MAMDFFIISSKIAGLLEFGIFMDVCISLTSFIALVFNCKKLVYEKYLMNEIFLDEQDEQRDENVRF